MELEEVGTLDWVCVCGGGCWDWALGGCCLEGADVELDVGMELEGRAAEEEDEEEEDAEEADGGV